MFFLLSFDLFNKHHESHNVTFTTRCHNTALYTGYFRIITKDFSTVSFCYFFYLCYSSDLELQYYTECLRWHGTRPPYCDVIYYKKKTNKNQV